ncbi:MAG: ATP-binding protein [Christensenellaceae bacterium]|jgi:hypothetical protein|nr:ATP-binding protein [Christensenellaceae bacterium]
MAATVKWTFPTEAQIWEDFDPPASKWAACRASDFAKLLGVYISSANGRSVWWSASKHNNDYVITVYTDATRNWYYSYSRRPAARPASLFSDILTISPNGVRGKNAEGVPTYKSNLEYPQTAVEPGSDLEKRLNSVLGGGKNKTGKKYTVDSVPTKYEEKYYKQKFSPRELEEYILDGQKYVKVKALTYDSGDQNKLAGGAKFEEGKEYWVKVEPVTFLILKDKKTNKEWAVAENAMYAGIQMNNSGTYDGNLDKSDGGAYLNNHFAKDITPQKSAVQNTAAPQNGATRDSKRKGAFEITRSASIKERMLENFEDGCSMMLHGLSGVGKSRRVYELDPTYTSIVLRNGMMPEEVVGGKEPNGDPGMIYPPYWYTLLCEKCKKEPNRKQALFIDELTNVKETTQSMVYDIVLNRTVRPNLWELPDNAVVIAAGNSKEESTAAYNMPAPLFRRFDSHIEIPLDTHSWIEWGYEMKSDGSGQTKIHPLVSAFVMGNTEVLYSGYDDEAGDHKPTLDPRKWEKVSEVLYKAEKRGKISQDRISDMVGKDVASSLCEFVSRPQITVEDIKKKDYEHIPMENISDQMFVLGSLLNTSKDDKNIVKKFIKDELGEEMYAVYNSIEYGRMGTQTDKTLDLNKGVEQ